MKDTPLVVYTPEAQSRSPLVMLAAMFKDMYAARELAWRLFIRDVSAQYRQSLFGVLWAFIPPIVTSLIFIVLQSSRVLEIGATDIPYPVYVLVGTLLWQIFSESINAPLKAVTAAQAILVRVNFPREALIMSSFYLVLFNMIFKIIVLAGIFLYFRLTPTWGLLAALALMVMLVILGITLGLLLTPLGMLYTDISTSLPILIQLAFFITPVVYQPPQSFPFSLISVINPVSPLLIAARDLITKGAITNLTPVLIVCAITFVLLLTGWSVYRVAMPIFIERMSA